MPICTACGVIFHEDDPNKHRTTADCDPLDLPKKTKPIKLRKELRDKGLI